MHLIPNPPAEIAIVPLFQTAVTRPTLSLLMAVFKCHLKYHLRCPIIRSTRDVRQYNCSQLLITISPIVSFPAPMITPPPTDRGPSNDWSEAIYNTRTTITNITHHPREELQPRRSCHRHGVLLQMRIWKSL